MVLPPGACRGPSVLQCLGPALGPSSLFEAGSDTPKRRGEPKGCPLIPCPGTWHHALGDERPGSVEGLQRDCSVLQGAGFCGYEFKCWAQSRQSCLTFCNLWTVAHQAPLSMEFSRQEYWSGLPCPPSGDLPNTAIEPIPLTSPALQASSLPLSHLGSLGCKDHHNNALNASACDVFFNTNLNDSRFACDHVCWTLSLGL